MGRILPAHVRSNVQPLSADDVALPSLKVGTNVLPSQLFDVATRKLLRDPEQRKAAHDAGTFAIDGQSGAVRVTRAK